MSKDFIPGSFRELPSSGSGLMRVNPRPDIIIPPQRTMISSNDLRPVAQMEGAGNMLVNLVKVGAVSTAIIVIGGGVVVLVNAATGVVIAAGVSIGALATAVGFLRHQMTKLDNAFGGDSGTALQIGGGREKHGAPNRTGISTSTAIDNHAVTHSNNTDNRRAQTAEHRNGGLNIFGKHTNETNGSKVIHNHEASKWPTAVAAIFIFSVLAMFAASGQSSNTENKSYVPQQPTIPPSAAKCDVVTQSTMQNVDQMTKDFDAKGIFSERVSPLTLRYGSGCK